MQDIVTYHDNALKRAAQICVRWAWPYTFQSSVRFDAGLPHELKWLFPSVWLLPIQLCRPNPNAFKEQSSERHFCIDSPNVVPALG